MKTTIYLLAVLTVCAVMSCSKDDAPLPPKLTQPPGGTTPPTETLVNKAPGTFDLIDIANGSDGIDLTPAFSWKAAVDPDAEAVTYDLYLDEKEDPTTLVAANLTEPNFTATDSLHLVTDYRWKVVAKDPKGATVSSAVNSFTTRNLRIPDQPLTKNPDFSPRRGHTSLVFQDKLWVIGGYDNDLKNDVWNSSDGEYWTRVSPLIPTEDIPQFSPRSSHVSLVFDNKIWVFAGRTEEGAINDAWFSEDGISWTLANGNTSFSRRTNHTVTFFENKLWLIGGANGSSFYQDIWYSTNGVEWTEATFDAQFSYRFRHSVTVFDDKLWLIGGGDGYSNDIWSSKDGLHWEEEISEAAFPKRFGHATVVFDNKLWLFGGVNYAENKDFNDVWYSSNGVDWLNAASNAKFQGTDSFSGVVFKNNIWVIGGANRMTDEIMNEVWTLD